MASVQKEIIIDTDPVDVWAVVGDFTDGPVRMAPGFVTDSVLAEPGIRIATFADGTIARERLIGIDDRTRRLAYSVIGDTMQPTHDNASMQVFAHGDGRSRFVWIHDVQPDDLADAMGAAMEHGLGVFKQTLESRR
ncbi:MAG TPA: SRPBCC family protein [Rhodococcus sp. (in: high G+C Gram-positive bacteria)]|nr:SRPBCC family protein [Rhodococcus sp. (in: high G+C Gram-positive bacteria)]